MPERSGYRCVVFRCPGRRYDCRTGAATRTGPTPSTGNPMKNSKLASAVVAGYFLGRWHKARWALALAGVAAGKKLSTNPGVLLGQLMESSPQLRGLVDEMQIGR